VAKGELTLFASLVAASLRWLFCWFKSLFVLGHALSSDQQGGVPAQDAAHPWREIGPENQSGQQTHEYAKREAD
jgi:hypothetical protein